MFTKIPRDLCLSSKEFFSGSWSAAIVDVMCYDTAHSIVFGTLFPVCVAFLLADWTGRTAGTTACIPADQSASRCHILFWPCDPNLTE